MRTLSFFRLSDMILEGNGGRWGSVDERDAFSPRPVLAYMQAGRILPALFWFRAARSWRSTADVGAFAQLVVILLCAGRRAGWVPRLQIRGFIVFSFFFAGRFT